MGWAAAFALAGAMGIVAVAPAYFWLRLARIPSFISLVLAPAPLIFFLSLQGELYVRVGIPWSPLTVFPVLAGIALLGALLFRRWGPPRPQSHQGRWVFWAVVAGAWLLAVLPWMTVAPAENPVQQWDPTHHLNGVWSIVGSGDAGWNSALAATQAGATSNTYPSGWHIFVALFASQSSVVLTANASTIALILLWILGAAAYTRVLFPSPVAWTIAPLLASSTLGMPVDALSAYSQWPNATSLALLPGIAAFAVWLGRRFLTVLTTPERYSPQLWITWVAVGALSLLGALRTHPVVAFNLLFLLGAGVVAGAVTLSVHDWRAGGHRRWLAFLWPSMIILALLPLAYVYNLPTIKHMGDYPRSGQTWAVALSTFLTPAPPYGRSMSLIVWVTTLAILMSVALVPYLVKVTTKRPLIWPWFSFLTFAFLVLVAYGPDSSFREVLVAPWFLDARRIMEPQNLAMIPLAAQGFSWLSAKLNHVAPRFSRLEVSAALIAVILSVSGIFGFSVRQSAARGVYDPNHLGKPGMATAGELTMLQGLDAVLPEDAKVLGDPKNGSAYSQVIGQRTVVFPQLTLSDLPEDLQLLTQRFSDIHDDPAICTVLAKHKITHFYAEEDGYYYQNRRSDRTPGLYDVDTSKGFELVAQGDTARLYRITACD